MQERNFMIKEDLRLSTGMMKILNILIFINKLQNKYFYKNKKIVNYLIKYKKTINSYARTLKIFLFMKSYSQKSWILNRVNLFLSSNGRKTLNFIFLMKK